MNSQFVVILFFKLSNSLSSVSILQRMEFIF